MQYLLKHIHKFICSLQGKISIIQKDVYFQCIISDAVIHKTWACMKYNYFEENTEKYLCKYGIKSHDTKPVYDKTLILQPLAKRLEKSKREQCPVCRAPVQLRSLTHGRCGNGNYNITIVFVIEPNL